MRIAISGAQMTSHELFSFFLLAQHENRLFSSSARLAASRTKVNLPESWRKARARHEEQQEKYYSRIHYVNSARRRKKTHRIDITYNMTKPTAGRCGGKTNTIFFYVELSFFAFFPTFALPGWCDESFPSLFLKFNSHLWFCYWICGELNNGKVSLSCVRRCGCIRMKIGRLNRADLSFIWYKNRRQIAAELDNSSKHSPIVFSSS